MKQDKLNSKIQDELFDMEFEVPAGAWENIEKKLDKPENKKPWMYIVYGAIAASFLGFITNNITLPTNNVSKNDELTLLSKQDLPNTFSLQEDLTNSPLKEEPLHATTEVLKNNNTFIPSKTNNSSTEDISSVSEPNKSFIHLNQKTLTLAFNELYLKGNIDEYIDDEPKKKRKLNLEPEDLVFDLGYLTKLPESRSDGLAAFESGNSSQLVFADCINAEVSEYSPNTEFGIQLRKGISNKIKLKSGISYNYNSLASTPCTCIPNSNASVSFSQHFKHIGIPIGIDINIIEKNVINWFASTSVSIEKSLNIFQKSYDTDMNVTQVDKITNTGFQNGLHVETGILCDVSKNVSLVFKSKMSNFTILSPNHRINSRSSSFIVPQIHFGLNFDIN